MSALTSTFALSRETETSSPRLPTLPPTLMRSIRNFSCEWEDWGQRGGGGATTAQSFKAAEQQPPRRRELRLSCGKEPQALPLAKRKGGRAETRGAGAHKGRRVHDAIVDRLRAVDREFERLLPLGDLLRLGLRLRGG